jgi:anti-sigma B factor antagonist
MPGCFVDTALASLTGGRVNISERVVGDVTVLELQGKLALGDGVEQLRSTVNGLVAQGRTRIILHLEGVPFVDSAGLGEIVRAHTTAKRTSGALKLVRPTQRIIDLLTITKVRNILDTHDSEESALKSFP